uniref:Secreted protein n=1 Tax=Acrobeloides nanus TaxID=290746 RepID=A0A914EHD9_9BILA
MIVLVVCSSCLTTLPPSSSYFHSASVIANKRAAERVETDPLSNFNALLESRRGDGRPTTFVIGRLDERSSGGWPSCIDPVGVSADARGSQGHDLQNDRTKIEGATCD